MASEFNNTKHPQMIKTFMKNGNVLEILMYWRIKQSLIYKPAKKKKNLKYVQMKLKITWNSASLKQDLWLLRDAFKTFHNLSYNERR